MCTAFIHRGEDTVAGFNFDVDPAVWPYRLVVKKDMVYVGIRSGSTEYKIHGVNGAGRLAVLPYMNDIPEEKLHRGSRYQRIDLLCDRWIGGKLAPAELWNILREKTAVCVPGTSMHALLADGEGRAALLEPGRGWREETGRSAVVTNFPCIDPPEDRTNPFFGADRYEKVKSALAAADDSFAVQDALKLLESAAVEGQWGTRVSFVYSWRENAVYFCENRGFSEVRRVMLQGIDRHNIRNITE